MTKLGAVTSQPILNQVFLSDAAGVSAAGTKGRALMKSVARGPLTMLVSHVTNIQAMAGVQLDSGELAVVHFDASGQVVVDGRLAVP